MKSRNFSPLFSVFKVFLSGAVVTWIDLLLYSMQKPNKLVYVLCLFFESVGLIVQIVSHFCSMSCRFAARWSY